MNKIYLTIASCVSLSGALLAQNTNPCDSVIPKPVSVKAEQGSFKFSKGFTITGHGVEGAKLAKAVKAYTGVNATVQRGGDVILNLEEDKSAKIGSYKIDVDKDKITITASSDVGLFYGSQTLVQMIDKTKDGWEIPCAEISDSPRFEWRGLMLDEARHFFGKEAVMLVLDNMAKRKMNRFHWHLTDDEGWRVEIKGYPKLTEIAAWRGKGTPMPRVKWRSKEEGKGPRYGGFYTQEDLKEIVAYAKERHIDVIPEIDMPGHVTALVTAYPDLSPTVSEETLTEARKSNPDLPTLEAAGDSARAYRDNLLSVVNPKTYEFCNAVFDQLGEIFPYEYWHIGGDEVRPLKWIASPEHQKLMKEKGFTDPHQLQNMFLLRMEKELKKRGKTMVGWNEIMKGGHMSNDTVVMAWISIGAGLKAAKAGYPTVMAVAPHNYFDMGYPGKGERRAHSWAGMIDSKRAYQWNPLFEGKLTPEEQKKVKGVHACVWAEFVPDAKDMSYKFWPRACSTAEVGWTPQADRNWEEFRVRLGEHLKFFDKNGTFYRVAPPRSILAKGKVRIENAYPNLETRYTLDGSDPAKGKVYKGEVFTAEEAAKLRSVTIAGNNEPSIIVEGAERIKQATFRLNDKKEQVTVTFDATSQIDQAGDWTVFATQEKGHTSSKITKLEVLENGKKVAEAETSADVKPNTTGSATIKLPAFTKGAKYEVKVTFTRAKAKPNRKVRGVGSLTIDR